MLRAVPTADPELDALTLPLQIVATERSERSGTDGVAKTESATGDPEGDADERGADAPEPRETPIVETVSGVPGGLFGR